MLFNSRKSVGLISCVFLLLIYLISVVFRAVTLRNTDVYKVASNYEYNHLIYPINWIYSEEKRNERFSRVDSKGVVVTDYDKILNLSSIKGIQYNPVNIARMVFHEGKYVNSEYEHFNFLRANLDWLVNNMDEKGRWSFDFDNNISRRVNYAPWYSGLAQGLGISALVRGYIIFDDLTYLEAAEKAIKPIITSIQDGGVLSTSKYGKVIEEYPFKENNIHVLNGYLYSLIGVYELSLIRPEYAKLLDEHLYTLEKILDKYNLPGGWSAYSLDEPTLRNHANYANPMYHQLHIAQLRFFCQQKNIPGFCAQAEEFEQDKNSFASALVHISYVVFRDFVWIYKKIR
ncbi:D-glucuronyl C5-epimerase family protein [Vibrio campbellii]|uniref:D-glucuronyl C5-epimerase family protein n=1 Tax=Vibrio campbellii TaxID=680 RepID=UPI0005EDCA11|nr:D-glucuronyl C5-epimerase family protein [Vibrio campbellii]